MNLSDFETHIDGVILTRGRDYFRQGRVATPEFDGDEWVAEVEGGEDYTVTVTLAEDGEILDSSCDCPYDRGEYCKHQAAVFYALKERGAKPDGGDDGAKKTSLETILRGIDKETLVAALLDLTARDRRVKAELLLRFCEEKDAPQYARGVICNAINAVARGGEVEFRDVRAAVSGANAVLKIIDEKIDSGGFVAAARLCVVVMEEMMALLERCDDSDDYVGNAVDEAINKIDEAASGVSDEREGEELFDSVYNHALSPVYDEWPDLRLDILSALAPLRGNSANKDKLEEYIKL